MKPEGANFNQIILSLLPDDLKESFRPKPLSKVPYKDIGTLRVNKTFFRILL